MRSSSSEWGECAPLTSNPSRAPGAGERPKRAQSGNFCLTTPARGSHRRRTCPDKLAPRLGSGAGPGSRRCAALWQPDRPAPGPALASAAGLTAATLRTTLRLPILHMARCICTYSNLCWRGDRQISYRQHATPLELPVQSAPPCTVRALVVTRAFMQAAAPLARPRSAS